MPKIRCALVCGGMSPEHSVSLVSAASIMRAMHKKRYEIIPILIHTDGTWVLGSDNPDELEKDGFANEADAEKDGLTASHSVDTERTQLVLGMGNRHLYAVSADEGAPVEDLGAIDVVFPVLHGAFGEDGTIQGMLEMAQIPYVGCGVVASGLAMDKHMMKIILDEANIPNVPYVLATATQWAENSEQIRAEIREKLSYPVFVKPARAGSSVGVTKVSSEDELGAALEKAHRVDPKALVETGIDGREIECAVLGGRTGKPARAAVLGEIRLGDNEAGFYDYNNKYLGTAELHLDIPAHVEETTAEKMRALAVKVFDAFGCEGLTRVDFFLTPEGEIYVNEHNTMPGFTTVSMYPKMWEAAGLTYPQLIDELVDLALERPLGVR